jgi:cell division protein FtsI/penicillin-binding protein 2
MKQPISRSKVLQTALIAAWTGLLCFLGFVQLARWKHYERQAQVQQGQKLPLLAQRGRVYDRLGRPLTLNRSCCSIQILPQWARDREDSLAGILASFGLAERKPMAAELRERDHLFWFKRRVDYYTGDSLRKVLLKRQFHNCTYVDDDLQRVYPYGPSCATVLGFVGDERGLAGIESEYDSTMRGRSGWILLQRDALGRCFPYPSYPMVRPSTGADVRLTIDLDVQQVCYEALQQKVESSGALHGSVVVMDAATGAILGLADYPSYEPADYKSYPKELHKAAAICDQIEPGSSFKMVICASALESPNAARLTSQTYDVSSGFVQIGSRKIHDVHNNGVLDFPGLFIKSSNPGCAMLSMQLDPKAYYQIAKALGFGSAVGIGLPGEGGGWLDRPDRLNTLRFANIAFGQGVTVTLLQLTAAYACVANDGAYMRPYLIESVRQGGRALRQFRPTRVRQVLKPETARTMKDIFERVVTEGTGTLARMDGVAVCGKTGTAQKVEPGFGYSNSKSRMTFIGFLPKDKPRYVIGVLIDEPKTERFAGTSCCPVFKQIAEALLLLDRMRSRLAPEAAKGRPAGQAALAAPNIGG